MGERVSVKTSEVAPFGDRGTELRIASLHAPWAEQAPDAGDFNNDGWLDVYVSHCSQDYNTLYVNQKPASFPMSAGLWVLPSHPWFTWAKERDLKISTTTVGWICWSLTVLSIAKWIERRGEFPARSASADGAGPGRGQVCRAGPTERKRPRPTLDQTVPRGDQICGQALRERLGD